MCLSHPKEANVLCALVTRLSPSDILTYMYILRAYKTQWRGRAWGRGYVFCGCFLIIKLYIADIGCDDKWMCGLYTSACLQIADQVGELLIHCRYGCKMGHSPGEFEVDPSGSL